MTKFRGMPLEERERVWGLPPNEKGRLMEGAERKQTKQAKQDYSRNTVIAQLNRLYEYSPIELTRSRKRALTE
jgi:hypothetical protein